MPREPTFEEIVAGDDPVAQASIEVIEAFTADQVEVHLIEDRGETLEWGAEYFDGAGGGYVTIFAGQRAEQRSSPDGLRSSVMGTATGDSQSTPPSL
jgi:hypothetical protein